MTVINALTVDVEDYFHIHAFSDVIRPEDWDSFEPRVERNTYRLLDILDSVEVQRSEVRGQRSEVGSQPPSPHGFGAPRRSEDGNQKTEDRRQKTESEDQNAAKQKDQTSSLPKATFFVLGWVAERYPNLVKEIHNRGHEVACHGYGHQRIHTQTIKEFKEDVKRSKEILENITGTAVIGYRAPTYSISKNTIWALEILFELGFHYDSSIFPIKHDFYGFPEAPRFPFYIDFTNGNILSQFQNPKYLHDMDFAVDSLAPDALRPAPASSLFEFPISTINLFGRNFPHSGGGYFRLIPYWYTRKTFRKLNGNSIQPTIFYIHPWELDPEIPRIKYASHLSRFRTYVNLRKTEAKFKQLLSDFDFIPLASVLRNFKLTGHS